VGDQEEQPDITEEEEEDGIEGAGHGLAP